MQRDGARMLIVQREQELRFLRIRGVTYAGAHVIAAVEQCNDGVRTDVTGCACDGNGAIRRRDCRHRFSFLS